MSSKAVFGLLALTFIPMLALYISFSGNVMIGAVLAVAMLVIGFFFSTVSGALVGMIGSSNNPISGLTLATLLIAALLVLAFGIGGAGATAVVLGVAAVVCVAAAVAGELYQDFKVGYILGGTPRTIQIVELVAVVVSSLLMYFPLYVLHQGDINAGGIGFTGPALPAPQAGLMAALTQGIVGGDMPWSLVLLGIFMGISMIMLKVRSPMLVAVGMYLPLHTTFAIFVGGIFRWVADSIAERRSLNEAQRGRVENTGILMASGMIAGEALIGLGVASLNFVNFSLPAMFQQPSYLIGLAVAGLLGFLLIQIPLNNAGRPEDPPAPRAIA
jgi:putative OPT family oligopeptide transporter